MDPRRQALTDLDAILARSDREPLSASDCMRCVDLLRLAPGRAREVAQTLSSQRSASGVDALLMLPPTVPGVVEGVFQAIARGTRRARRSGRAFPCAVGLDFRSSRARNFPNTLDGARRAFASGLERLRVGGKLHYRVVLRAEDDRLTRPTTTFPGDLQWLHSRVARLRGSRLWLNGWCFPQDGPMGPPIQVHLIHAWLGYATHLPSHQRARRSGAGSR